MNLSAFFGNPEANVSYNALAGVLAALGYAAIKLRWVRLHITCMLAALATSAIFLASYVDYHIAHGSTPFPGPTLVKCVYYPILVTHVLLAAVVPVLALYTAYLGLRGRFIKHVRIARWTLPMWFYVSVTGVIVYWMLYRLYAT
jgi:putative membrane protein